MKTHDVFISHSSKDKIVADSIVAALEAAHIRCWIAPRDIKPGTDWGEESLRRSAKARFSCSFFPAIQTDPNGYWMS